MIVGTKGILVLAATGMALSLSACSPSYSEHREPYTTLSTPATVVKKPRFGDDDYPPYSAEDVMTTTSVTETSVPVVTTVTTPLPVMKPSPQPSPVTSYTPEDPSAPVMALPSGGNADFPPYSDR